MSRRRYLVRRLLALGVLILVVGAGFRLADAVFDSSDTEAADGGAATSVASDPGAAVTSGTVGAGAVTDPATESVVEPSVADTAASTDPATTSGAPTVPSAATPAEVLIAGDSDAGTFGPYLVTLLDETGIVQAELDYKVSSGLSRPDFFDWSAHFRTQISAKDPDIVVVTFGGNDAQGLSNIGGTFIVGQPSGGAAADGGVSDPEWRAEYGRRVGEVMDFLSADGRTLIWVGIPNDDQEPITARLAVQNDVVKAEVAKRPDVVFVDTWSRFSGRDGNWAEYVIDPRDGQGKDVRAADGFHLNENGAEILALDIAEAVKRALRERGAVV